MSALYELQLQLQDWVLHGREGIRHKVVGTDRVSAATRLKIYSNAYRLRLIEVLQSDYEVLHTLLGDDAFDNLARTYIDQHPSTHPNIRWFGAHMAELLHTTAPYDAHPLLAETARFEWALGGAFDAADFPPIDGDAVTRIPPESWPDMQPVLHRSTQRLTLRWNTVEIWKAIQAEETPEQPRPLDSPASWVIWRKGLQPHFRSLAVDEAWALEAVMEGHTFGQVCEGLYDWIDEQHIGARAAGILKSWVSEGMVVEIQTA